MPNQQTVTISISNRYLDPANGCPALRMEVSPEVINELEALSQNQLQVEQAGILGISRNSGILTHIYLDEEARADFSSVKPATHRINAVLERWKQKDVIFAGLFHTHCSGMETLSRQDLVYARSILTHNHIPCMLMGVITRKAIHFYAVDQEPKCIRNL